MSNLMKNLFPWPGSRVGRHTAQFVSNLRSANWPTGRPLPKPFNKAFMLQTSTPGGSFQTRKADYRNGASDLLPMVPVHQPEFTATNTRNHAPEEPAFSQQVTTTAQKTKRAATKFCVTCRSLKGRTPNHTTYATISGIWTDNGYSGPAKTFSTHYTWPFFAFTHDHLHWFFQPGHSPCR